MEHETKKSDVSRAEPDATPAEFNRSMSPIVPLLWILIPFVAVIVYGFFSGG